MTEATRQLDRGAIVRQVSQAVEAGRDKRASNVLLAGPWGAGKTTILKEIEVAYDTHVLSFSPWEQFADEDPRDAFIRLLAGEIAVATEPSGLSQKRLRMWQAAATWARGLAKNAIDAAVEADPVLASAMRVASPITGLARALAAAASTQEPARPMTATTAFRKNVRHVLKALAAAHGKKRILLLVDDLDRTRPEYAVAVLEQLYHAFMPIEGNRRSEERAGAKDWPLSSIWAVNIDVLEEFLYERYRFQPSFDSTAYLEKMFDRRVNVPPLFRLVSPGSELDEPAQLWMSCLSELTGGAHLEKHERLARRLSSELDYSCLGNLRLYETVRRRSSEYWQFLASGELGSLDTVLERSADLIAREVRMIALVQAYPGFRERTALYSGMWPQFVNRLNDWVESTTFELIEHPVYRHLDDPSLATMLLDLGVLSYDESSSRYFLDNGGSQQLASDLAGLLRCGF